MKIYKLLCEALVTALIVSLGCYFFGWLISSLFSVYGSINISADRIGMIIASFIVGITLILPQLN